MADTKTMEIELRLDRDGSYVIEVNQSEILDAGIIKYQGQYFIYDSKLSTPFNPVFSEAKLYEAK